METSDHSMFVECASDMQELSVSCVQQGATLLLEVKHDNVHFGNYGTNRITNG